MRTRTHVRLNARAKSIAAAIIPGEGQDADAIKPSSDLMKVRRLIRRLSDKGSVFKEGKSTWTKKHRQWLASLRQTLDSSLQTAFAFELEHPDYLEAQKRSINSDLTALPSSITSDDRPKLSPASVAPGS